MSETSNDELSDEDVVRLLEQIPDCDSPVDSVAVCIRCGQLKAGAFITCLGCGFEPVEKQDQVKSLLLSDRLLSPSEIAETSARLKRGESVPYDEFRLHEYAKILPYLNPRRFLGVRMMVWLQIVLAAVIFASPFLLLHLGLPSGLPGLWEIITDHWTQSPDRISVDCRVKILNETQEARSFETHRELTRGADGKFRFILGGADTLQAEIEIEPNFNRKNRVFITSVRLVPGPRADNTKYPPRSDESADVILGLSHGERKVLFDNRPRYGVSNLELVVTELPSPENGEAVESVPVDRQAQP